MKKRILMRLITTFSIMLLISLAITIVVEYYSLEMRADESGNQKIEEIADIIASNDVKKQDEAQTFERELLAITDAIAYILGVDEQVQNDSEKLREIADLMTADEINLFDENGNLYSGTNEEYYGSSFESGEQMQFFAQMLDNRDARLVQEITDNTVSGKSMQYFAIWSLDKSYIIQVGIEGEKVLEATKGTAIEDIISYISITQGEDIYIIDEKSQTVTATTNSDVKGQGTADIGIDIDATQELPNGVFINIDGESVYVHAMMVGDEIFLYAMNTEVIFESLVGNIVLIVSIVAAACVLATLVVYKIINTLIIKNINKFIAELHNISSGELSRKIDIDTVPEFAELSKHINVMVENLLKMSGKMSTIFDYADMPMAMYQCGTETSGVVATNKIGSLLRLDEKETQELLSDSDLFLEKISTVCSNAHDIDKDIFVLEDENGHYYLKIKAYFEDTGTWGIIQDVTEEIEEKKNIEHERDMDFLTNIYSRRAFITATTKLFKTPQKIKDGALIMMDLDNLKYVNDNFGHEHGDKYICKAADTLENCEAPHKIAARLSGDEFAIFIYGNSTSEETEDYVQRLYKDFRNATIETPEGNFPLGISGGYISYPTHSKNFREMLTLADETMYMVKHTTKGRFLKYDPENHISMDKDEDDLKVDSEE